MLDDIGDRDAEPGTLPWAKAIILQTRLSVEDVNRDISLLQGLINSIEKYSAWKLLGYPSLDLLLVKETKIDPDAIAAVRAARKGTTIGAVLGKQGRPRKGEEKGSERTLIVRGETSTYLTARLARDHPAISRKLEAGGYPSVRAAAIEAGIVKPMAQIRTDDPAKAAAVILRHFQGERLKALIAALRT
jgi:hypothetical protein